MIDNLGHKDSLIFQIDLFNAEGPLPRDLGEVEERQKDIQYSSKSRFNMKRFKEIQNFAETIRRLLDKLPP